MLYDPVKKKFVRSHDVQFMEDQTIEDIDKLGDGFDIPLDDDAKEEQEMSQDENPGDAPEPPLVQLKRSNRQRQSSTSILLMKLGFIQDEHCLLCDSHSAIHLGKNSTFHSMSKHINVRYHWIHDALDAKLLELAKVHTDDNDVDMMTKSIDLFGLGDPWMSIG
ncbi:hypothetical protein CR513_10445, partial [Mucuna pruriens]